MRGEWNDRNFEANTKKMITEYKIKK